VPLGEFLAARFPYRTRAAWDAEIVAGRVRVNGCAVVPGRTLVFRDCIETLVPEGPEPPVCQTVGVILDDPDFLVIDKPANLPVQPGGRYFRHTLWAWLKDSFGLAAPILINRLDRETSGLMLVARHERAARALRAQFAARTVEKRYLALVEGRFPDAAEAAGCLVEDPASPVRKKRLFRLCEPASMADEAMRAGSAWAETRFRRLSEHGPLSLVEARPLTGRLHQIRATLQALGFPVVGDKLYGFDPAAFLRFCADELTDDDRRRLRLSRQALHAAGLRFRHPRTRDWLDYAAPLPADLAELIRRW
jgi:23S rRNA pseudouridine955/2504/2580 synthase/23S rRNA pseudouridine1911/1915/1917 synthase